MLEISLKSIPHNMQHCYAHKILENSLKKIGIDYSCSEIKYGEYGKPYLADFPDIHYNLSHSDGITVCYIGRLEAGVDAECVKKLRPRVAKRVFTETELALIESTENPDLMFYQLWTLKESYVKAIGIGVSFPMKNIELSFNNGKIISNIENCQFTQHIIKDKFVISLCRIL